MKKISVIFPVYNVEYDIKEALNSLLNQTIVDDIEVIMVDDGSTDHSKYIIDEECYIGLHFYTARQKNGKVHDKEIQPAQEEDNPCRTNSVI